MKTYLKAISDRFYHYINKDTRTIYTLSYGDRGVYGNGKSWYLNVQYYGASLKNHVATFTTKTDGHHCEREDYKGRLWDFGELFVEANKMIGKMEG